MRIANNIMAMNTHRAYTTNNDKIASSAEKLSSGYRINKAGDDAAGLAISEKMRAQIRGLNMAKRNSQDAISLIQTAEGALQEVHSILQRMNELAVQSATGTNEEFDRTQIAKEFEQLKREVNDISEQTTFNNMKILDGSLSAEGVRDNRSAYTSGVYSQFEKTIPPTSSAVGGVKDITFTEGAKFIDGTKASFTIDLSGMELKTNATGDFGIQIGSTKIVTTELAGLVKGATAETFIQNYMDENNYDPKDITTAPTVKINNVDYIVQPDGDYKKLVFTAKTATDIKASDLEKISVDAIVDDGTASTSIASEPTKAGAQNIVAGKAPVNATAAKAEFTYDVKSVKSGDQFSIGADKFTFYSALAGDAVPAVNGINIDNVQTAAQLATEINKVIVDGGTRDAKNEALATYIEGTNKVIITFTGTAGSVAGNNVPGAGANGPKGNEFVQVNSISKDGTKAWNGTTTFELDLDKLKENDAVTWTTEDGSVKKYYITKQSTVDEVVKSLGIDKVDGFQKIVGNTWIMEGNKDFGPQIGFEAAQDEMNYDVMKIQIGALESEQLSIKIAAMNTKGLALDEAEIYTQDKAGTAITSTRSAINQVSDQRARLGAMQNRMNHKINNLAISAENLQAAESRIRDIDIASEMTSFTQANILSQAATAMLAQANSAPQNVLSLLK